MFEPTTQALLTQAGWYPGRNTEISHFLDCLERQSFECFASAQEFLKEFGGLSIAFPCESRATTITDRLEINPCRDAFEIAKDVQYLQPLTGSLLCPIGSIHRADVHLLIDPKGTVYGTARHQYMGVVGDTVNRSVERILACNQWMHKMLLPYNDDHLQQLISAAQTLALIGPLPGGGRLAQIQKFVNETHLKVLVVGDNRFDKLANYPSVQNIQEPIDIVWQPTIDKIMMPLLKQAIEVNAKVVWGPAPRDLEGVMQEARAADIEVITGIDFVMTYKRLFAKPLFG